MVKARPIRDSLTTVLGGHHNAPSLMATVDFADVERLQHQSDWSRLETLLAKAAQNLERGGADFIVLCTNTMHKLADAITAAVEIPLVPIVDATPPLSTSLTSNVSVYLLPSLRWRNLSTQNACETSLESK